MTHTNLTEVRQTRIDDKWPSSRLTAEVLEAWSAESLEPLCKTLDSFGIKESVNGSTVLSALGCQMWAEVAHEIGHNPENTPWELYDALFVGAEHHFETNEQAESKELVFAAFAHTYGVKMSKHVSEKSIVDHFETAEMAGVDVETEKVDILEDSAEIQVFTGTGSTSWWSKAWNCGKAEAYERAEREGFPFDYYVVAYPNDDGTIGIGVRDVREKDATTARTLAKNA